MLKNTKSLLILSTLLNILLFGFITWGSIYHARIDAQRWMVVKEALAPEVRHQVSRYLQKLQKDITSAEKREQKARKKLLKVMKASEFKEATYDKAIVVFDEKRVALTTLKAEGYKPLLDMLARENRSKMAEHLVRHYEGSHQELKSDLAREVEEAHKNERHWWN